MATTIDVDHRRALLVARHRLGTSGRAERTIADLARALGPLHSTDPATPYLSLCARSDASVDEIDRALYEDRSLGRFTTLRRTVFAMDADAASAAHAAYNPALVAKLRTQLLGWLATSDDVNGRADRFLRRTEDAVLAFLEASGPSTGTELAESVAGLRARFDPQPGASYSRPIRATSKVLEILGAELRIVRGRPTGADLTSASWRWELPAPGSVETIVAERGLAEADALRRLLERYLASFGPATVTDMSWWTGLTKTKVKAALRAMDAVEVRVDAADGEPAEQAFVLAGDDLGASTVAAGSPGDRVALLPGLDSTTMGWKQRAWYVDDSPDAGLFDRNGNAGPTVWVDGRVVGSWTQRGDGSVAVELVDGGGHAPVPSDLVDRIHAEAERIGAWLGDIRVKWRYPTPITKRLGA